MLLMFVVIQEVVGPLQELVSEDQLIPIPADIHCNEQPDDSQGDSPSSCPHGLLSSVYLSCTATHRCQLSLIVAHVGPLTLLHWLLGSTKWPARQAN